MKRKRLTGWKRMAAFAMALTLTVGDWTSAGAAGLRQTDVQTVTDAERQEEDADGSSFSNRTDRDRKRNGQ